MNSDSEISTSSIKIQCHSSKEYFCRGDICFIEYAHIAPTITEYGCIELDKNIDHKVNSIIIFSISIEIYFIIYSVIQQLI
jgi:hypothetical protein